MPRGLRRDLDLAWSASVQDKRLENEISAYLKESRHILIRRLAEISIGKIGVDGVQVCPVKEIEELKAELEIHRFRNLCILQESYIPLLEPRFTEGTIAFVPFRTERGGSGKVS